jgi:DNA-binding transcriptional MerR regulator
MLSVLQLSTRSAAIVSEPRWRIDELAHEAGVTVDTIRYYAREGLLEPPERAGRHKLYGPAHLDRLGRIRELQGRRFSLAAIRAILDVDRPGIEGIFTSQGSYSFDELVGKSGLDEQLVVRLREVGLLADPETLGHEVYDDSDLALLRAVVELREIGMTEDILVELGSIYVRHFRALQKDVHDMLSGKDRDDWDADEMVAVQRKLTANSQRMIPAVDRVLNYVHQRTIQRLTLDAVRTAQETRTGVGGVRLAPDEDAPTA